MAVGAGTRSIYRTPWRIDLSVRAGIPVVLSQAALAEAVRAALEAAGAPGPASVGLILTDDAEMAGLNLAHMGVSGPTDVLAFPLLPPGSFPGHEDRPVSAPADVAAAAFPRPPGTRQHLGDVVVSVERAIDQAGGGRGGHTGDVRWSAADELRLLATHGTLHLCGWDHAEPSEEAAMRALERRLLGIG